jgi:hypothetical protein
MAETSTIPGVESAGIRRRGMARGRPHSLWSNRSGEESTTEELEQSEASTPGDPRKNSSLSKCAVPAEMGEICIFLRISPPIILDMARPSYS